MFDTYFAKNYPEAVKFLTNSIKKNKLANSYVFIGNTSDDILRVAINLAKILNCTKNNEKYSTPCETCINCKWINKKEHPKAFIHIKPDPTSKKEQIKIETIRELLEDIKLSQEYFRIIFFENASMACLTPECCNLLLKVVEETPNKTVFIFSCKSKSEILKTILSRSQTIYLNKKYNEFFKPSTSESMVNLPKKSDEIQKILSENKIELKDYLLSLAFNNYETMKDNTKEFCFLYQNIQKCFVKANAFMQPKIVMEDLLLELNR